MMTIVTGANNNEHFNEPATFVGQYIEISNPFEAVILLIPIIQMPKLRLSRLNKFSKSAR